MQDICAINSSPIFTTRKGVVLTSCCCCVVEFSSSKYKASIDLLFYQSKGVAQKSCFDEVSLVILEM
jgi:hypothetical protein